MGIKDADAVVMMQQPYAIWHMHMHMMASDIWHLAYAIWNHLVASEI
jgi:hypothetical protein